MDVQLLMKEAAENNTLEAVHCFVHHFHFLLSSLRQTQRGAAWAGTKLNTARSWNCSIKTRGSLEVVV